MINPIVSNTAILLFTRTAKHEAEAKTFINKRNNVINRTIAAHLIAKTRKIAKNTTLPFYIISDDKQSGFSFGERLANAAETVFNIGFNKIIILGNDCPRLTSIAINKAAALLQEADFVTGATEGGGLYLIGLTRAHFAKEKFVNIPWQTNLLADCFNEFVTSVYGTIRAIPIINDINNEFDLLSQIKYLASFDRLKIFIHSVTTEPLTHSGLFNLCHNFMYNNSTILRGPPKLQ